MAHVLVRANKVVKTIRGVGDLTSAESANGGVRYEVNAGVEIYIGGTVTVTGGKVSAITNPDALTTAQERRIRVKNWLQVMEAAPVSNWSLKDMSFNNNRLIRGNSTTRAKNYWNWLEMVAAHSSKDANLTTAARWSKIESEMTWRPLKWYNDHNRAQWSNLTLATLLNTFYGTSPAGGPVADSSFDGYSSAGDWEGLTSYIDD